MKNALADLALEWEASFLLGMRMAAALDNEQSSPHDKQLLRVGVPIAKYWNCKRVNHFVLEALECHGGMGFVEEQPIARLLREAPLNSIWEGTSAMMGLDFVRSLRHNPETKQALSAEIRAGLSGNSQFRRFAASVEDEIGRTDNDLEPHARRLISKAALCLQASLLYRFGPTEAADLFVASRMNGEGTAEFGTLPSDGALLAQIIERAVPE